MSTGVWRAADARCCVSTTLRKTAGTTTLSKTAGTTTGTGDNNSKRHMRYATCDKNHEACVRKVRGERRMGGEGGDGEVTGDREGRGMKQVRHQPTTHRGPTGFAPAPSKHSASVDKSNDVGVDGVDPEQAAHTQWSVQGHKRCQSKAQFRTKNIPTKTRCAPASSCGRQLLQRKSTGSSLITIVHRPTEGGDGLPCAGGRHLPFISVVLVLVAPSLVTVIGVTKNTSGCHPSSTRTGQ